jgi:hypothetical protein
VSPRSWRVAGALKERDRRALAWGLAVVVPALLVTQMARPALGAYRDLRARLERERDLLQREENLLADRRQFRSRYAAVEHAVLVEAPRLFGGPDLTAAAAGLGSYVNAQAYAHRVMVQRSEPGPPVATASGVARLQLDVQGVSDLAGIMGLLQSLETGPKLVAVERLAIVQTAPITSGTGAQQEALAFGATVVGYALADSTEQPAR